ncbi:hypothetical protein TNCV_1106311 [Trichonephila clavipes]|nr:hypothetical protein TNCV_1106311 [Trichonephila clavipes]
MRLEIQYSGHSTVDEIASEAADCRLTYTMANCHQKRSGKTKSEKKKKERKSSKKTMAGCFGKRSKEDPGVLDRDADQES